MELNFSAKPLVGIIRVITGIQGMGKTTYCQKMVEQYRGYGWKTSGLLSIGRFTPEGKNGIYALDLDSGVSRLLASRVEGELEGIRFGSWVFDAEVLEWGNEQLTKINETDLLVIDELGPLEFHLNKGWTAAFELLRQKNYRLAMVVIRPELLEHFTNMGFTYWIKGIIKPESENQTACPQVYGRMAAS